MAKLRISEGHGIVPNTILNNPGISLKVQGLYAYIQSKPNGWDFSAARIAKSHTDGIDSVKAGLKCLESLGLLTRTKYRLKSGLRDWEYCLHAVSQLVTMVENPPMVNPSVVNPSTENPLIKKTRNSKQEIVNNNKTISSNDDIEETSSSENEIDDFLPGEGENIQSTTPPPPSKIKDKEFGDPEINKCLDIIKSFNEGSISGSKGEQRQYANHLIKKIKELEKVKNGKFTWENTLEALLNVISENEFHRHKIGGPKSIYHDFGGLIQIAKGKASSSKTADLSQYAQK